MSTGFLKSRLPIFFASVVVFLFSFIPHTSAAFFISQLKGEYRNGQVFLTWKCPDYKNLKYTIYRSKNKLVSESKLNKNTYLGCVRDSSSKNLRRSRNDQQDVFYKIEEGGMALSSNTGLYVATCKSEGSYYYAVIVSDMDNGYVAKKLTIGKNSLAEPIAEHVADPQPVWQDSVLWSDGEHAQMYVLFGDNQHLPHFPAMTNEGSFGFNFYVLKRGNAAINPLFVFYEGLKENSLVGNGLDEFANQTNCYFLGLDDWIPYPNGYGPDAGKGTFWCGYHEDYNIYSSTNPVPTSGVVHTYTQNHVIYCINWARKNLPVDTTQVNLVGVSSGGYGVLLTSYLIPEKIASVYAIVEPDQIASNGFTGNEMWGTRESNLKSDVLNPETGDTIRIFDFMNANYMLQVNKNQSLPYLCSVHGKNDYTTGWKEIPNFYDTLQLMFAGGVYYWDQREHDGQGSNFLDSETMPSFDWLRSDLSYPAFSNCSINADPGNGNREDGSPHGAINGYLKWVKKSITDEPCDYDVKVYLKDLYVGGVLDAKQYSTCFTDISFRRLQYFKPQPGQSIKWSCFDSSNKKIQGGSFIYNGGLITLKGIQVDKTANRIELKISDCEKELGSAHQPPVNEKMIPFIRTSGGWQSMIYSEQAGELTLNVYNILGEMVVQKSIQLTTGENMIFIPCTTSGIYIVQMKSHSMLQVQKLEY